MSELLKREGPPRDEPAPPSESATGSPVADAPDPADHFSAHRGQGDPPAGAAASGLFTDPKTCERMVRELALITEIGRTICSTLEIREVYERVASETRKLIPYDRLIVSLKVPKPYGDAFFVAYVAGIEGVGRRSGDTIPFRRESLAAEVVRMRRGMLVQPAGYDEALAAKFPRMFDPSQISLPSTICVPMKFRDDVIGTIHLRAKERLAYTERDLWIAERIGEQVAAAIVNAQLFADRKQAEEEMAIIAEIGRIVSSSFDIGAVYERFAAEARKLIPFYRLLIDVNDFTTGTTRIVLCSGAPLAGQKNGDAIPLAGTFTEKLIQQQHGILLNPHGIEDLAGYPYLIAHYQKGERSIISVPLVHHDRVIGALHIRSLLLDAYTEHHLALAERIGGQIAGAIANAELHAELRQTDQSLRESEARYRAIFAQAAVGVAEIETGTGRFLAVNRRQCEILGMTEEALLAATLPEVTHPDDRQQHLDKVEQLRAGMIDSLTKEKRCIRKDGAVIWVKATASPLERQGDRLIREIVVMEDISQRKALEQDLHDTLDRLEAMVKQRTLELEETNTALKVLLRKRSDDHKDLGEKLQANVKQLVLPFLERLKTLPADRQIQTYLNIIETNLGDILSPLISQLSATFKKLTPKEVQIAELIRQGQNSKEIAEMFGSSVATINTHRNNIRRKLELKKKKTNLRSYLLSLS